MELDELKQTWNAHARKLDRILSLNLQGLKTAQLDKTRSALGGSTPIRRTIVASSQAVGQPIRTFIRNRSRWASGSG